MTFRLFTTANGAELLINGYGLILEREPEPSERAVMTLPHNFRDGKARIVLSNTFAELKEQLLPVVPAPDYPTAVPPTDFIERLIPASEDLPAYDPPGDNVEEKIASEPAPRRNKKKA